MCSRPSNSQKSASSILNWEMVTLVRLDATFQIEYYSDSACLGCQTSFGKKEIELEKRTVICNRNDTLTILMIWSSSSFKSRCWDGVVFLRPAEISKTPITIFTVNVHFIHGYYRWRIMKILTIYEYMYIIEKEQRSGLNAKPQPQDQVPTKLPDWLIGDQVSVTLIRLSNSH